MERTAFPIEVEEFDSDDRISFSRLDNKFIAVHDDGTEFEFITEQKSWIPIQEHNVEDESWNQNGHSAGELSHPAALRKRRHADDLEDEGRASNDQTNRDPPRLNRPSKKQKAPSQPKQNTAVYVSGLPSDATVEEVNELFSRKAGVIAEEIDSGAPRIKMYADADGNFKGDALIVFFKPQSVQMAIMLLDDTDFRVTAKGTREGRISVQEADSSYKKVQYDQDGTPNAEKDGKGDGEKRSTHTNERKKIIKKTQKLDAKLADWDDDEPVVAPIGANSKKDRMAVLEHMFTLEELAEDPAALLEIKEDIRDECSKLGTVTSVVLYDEEPDGIVTIKFKDPESAMACINLMHGRCFDGRTVEAYLATGRERFKRSKEDQGEDSE